MWRTSIVVPHAHVSSYMAALEDIAETVSAFSLGSPPDEAPETWQIELLSSALPNDAELTSRIGAITAELTVKPPHPITEVLPERDWVADAESRLGPVTVDRFHVRGSHVPPSLNAHVYEIVVEAGRAFGSGHHETTQGCLRAIEVVARRRGVKRALDLGTGSAVLAIAVAKRNRIPVVGIDIDPHAVGVAAENIRLNGCARWIRAVVSDGRRNAAALGRFDLVVANIFAKPLLRLLPDISRLARPSATLIVSGIVTRQEAAIVAAYRRAGFTLGSRIVGGEWPTLILDRGGFRQRARNLQAPKASR